MRATPAIARPMIAGVPRTDFLVVVVVLSFEEEEPAPVLPVLAAPGEPEDVVAVVPTPLNLVVRPVPVRLALALADTTWDVAVDALAGDDGDNEATCTDVALAPICVA